MSQTLVLLLSAVVSGVMSFVVSRASTRYDYKLARKSRAVEKLTPHLYALQDLVVMARPGMVNGREFADAVVAWNTDWKIYRVGLPRNWGFIYREVNAAVGTFAGPQVFAAIDRSVWNAPLEEYDWEWQTNAELYLEHVAACVARSDERRPEKPHKFDEWLGSNAVRLLSPKGG